MRIFKKDFIFSWLLAIVVMFGISYLWHGYFLNDFYNNKLPTSVFLSLLLLVYAVISFAITFVYQYTNSKKLKKKGFVRGFLIGAVMGFFIYLIAFVLGISFKDGSASYHIVIDFIWQMIEQGIGGGVIGYALLVFSRARRLAEIS